MKKEIIETQIEKDIVYPCSMKNIFADYVVRFTEERVGFVEKSNDEIFKLNRFGGSWNMEQFIPLDNPTPPQKLISELTNEDLPVLIQEKRNIENICKIQKIKDGIVFVDNLLSFRLDIQLMAKNIDQYYQILPSHIKVQLSND